jgi:phytoene synthase
MDADEYCRNKVAAEGTTLYYSLLFVTADTRRAITALRALGEELRELSDRCSDVNVGRSRLAWWHEELARLLDGAPRHPATSALGRVLQPGGPGDAHLHALLDGAARRLQAGGYASRSQMEEILALAEGALGALTAVLCTQGSEQDVAFGRNLFTALGHAWIARTPKRHGWRSFTYLPGDELARGGVTREDLAARQTGSALKAVVKTQLEHARSRIRDALSRLPESRRGEHLATVTEARMELAILDAVERSGYRVLERPAMISPLRKLWIAWRTART